MKRKSDNSNRDPPRIRSSSIRGGFNGSRTNRPPTADTTREKRVKFTEEIDLRSHNEPAISTSLRETTGGQKSNGAKTSEYAFFKKLKKDAGCCGSRVVREEDKQLKMFEPSSRTEDMKTRFRDNFDNIRSSIHLDRARPNTHNIFSSPQTNAQEYSESARVVENRHNEIRSTHIARRDKFSNQNLFLSPLSSASEKSGSEYLDEDMFHQKRKRLRQWVAETSAPDIDKLCSKGFDLVSALLNRLFPNEDESQCCRRRDTSVPSEKADITYSSDEFLQKDTCSYKFHCGRRRDVTEAEPILYLDDFIDTSRETIPLNLDLKLLNYPSTSQCSSDEFLLEDICAWKFRSSKRRDLIQVDADMFFDDDCFETREMIPNTRTSNSPSFSYTHFQYENEKAHFNYDNGTAHYLTVPDHKFYGSNSFVHIKEINEFQAMDGSAADVRGLNTLLLGRDYGDSKDTGDIYLNTCHKGMNSLLTLSAPKDDHHLSLCNSIKLHDVYSSLSNLDHPSEITLFPQTNLENASYWDSEMYFDEEKRFAADLRHYSLPSSYIPEYLNSHDDCDTYTSYECNKGVYPRHDDLFSEKHFSESGSVLPSGVDTDAYCKYLSSSGFLGELHSSNYLCLQSPQKESNLCLLIKEEQDFFYSSKNGQVSSRSAGDVLAIHPWPSVNLQKSYEIELAHSLLHSSSSRRLLSEECE